MPAPQDEFLIEPGKPRLIYIAGYGRSGSTLLDSLLNSHDAIFGAGEAMWLFQHVVDQANCSCGESLVNCTFWRQVFERVSAEIGHDDWNRLARLTLVNERLFSWHREREEYTKVWNATFQAIYAVSGKTWIVDSSKSTRLDFYRLPLLANQLSCPVKVIHLVRDPRAVMWSVGRGSNRKMEAGEHTSRWDQAMAKSLLSWSFSNGSVEALRGRNPQWDVLRIRYEDLVNDPKFTLNRLGDFLNLTFAETMARISGQDSFAAGHGIAGNRMRRSGQIILRHDREWETKLPRLAKFYSRLAWPLLRKYQY